MRSMLPSGNLRCKKLTHSRPSLLRRVPWEGKEIMTNEWDHQRCKWETASWYATLLLVEDPENSFSFWEDKIHVIVARKGEGSPVYDVRPESRQGPSRTLHRNLLLPCDYLPGKPWEDPPPIKRTRPPTPYHCHEIQPLRHEDSDDDLPAISYCNHSPENDQM